MKKGTEIRVVKITRKVGSNTKTKKALDYGARRLGLWGTATPA